MTSISPVTRLYWLLVISGPLTLPEIRDETNWTTHDANSRLSELKRTGCVRLIERGQHGESGHRCGRWMAITEREIMDAEEASA